MSRNCRNEPSLEELLKKTRPEDDCRIWMGATLMGSPIVYIGARKKIAPRKLIAKHKGWEVHYRMPATCGNPLCVEPAHIQRSAHTQLTLEGLLARTVEVGDCREWQDYSGNGTPLVHDGTKMQPVRRVINQLLGKPVGKYLVPRCDNPACVAPEHIQSRTQAQHSQRMAAKVDMQAPARVLKLQKTARAHRGKITEEIASAIFYSTTPAKEEAARYNIAKSLVCRIRRGESWRELSAANNPWVGLMRA